MIICRPATCKVFTGKGTGVANSENNLVKGNNCYRQPPRGPTSSTQKKESVRSSDSVQVKSIVIGHCPSYSFGGHRTHPILTPPPSPPPLFLKCTVGVTFIRSLSILVWVLSLPNFPFPFFLTLLYIGFFFLPLLCHGCICRH